MTNISLRSYTREIEKLIDSSQADQAVAHCRHILKSYPKCVDAYRLLGKAYLESQRYGDAADIFQRVLSSVPDDFVSHVGMSLIREDEGNLDQAIWHMERAFEVQPANAAIQGELRRLYGRRDGMEPPKIRLTRGALARMYARGELYQQAVAEIRNALAEDPNRLDLIGLLASVYAQAGQKAEAVEMCNGLLRKLPYSLDGNRIMSEMLKDTDRVQDLQVYKRRLVALNPYFAQLSPAAPTVDRVPDQSVTIERLQWSPGMVVEGPSSQPEWAASLGVQLSGMTSEKDILPDWLMNLEGPAGEKGKPTPTGESARSASPFDDDSLMEFARESQKTEPVADKNANASTKPLKPTPEEAIPEWMKEAGWQPSSGEANEEEGSLSFAGEEDFLAAAAGESDMAQANIPEWLQAMAPSDAQGSEAAEDSGDEFAWLDGLQGEASAAQAESEEETDQPADWLAEGNVEVPDWLKEIDNEEPVDEMPPTSPPTGESTFAEPEIEEQPTEFAFDEAETGELSQDIASAEPEGKESVPTWLVEGMRGPDARTSSQTSTPQPQEEADHELSEDIPEWLRDFNPEEETTPEAESAEEEQVPDWLQSLTAEDEVGEQEIPEEIAEPGEGELEVTQEVDEAPLAQSTAAPTEEEKPAEPTPETQAEIETVSEAEAAGIQEAQPEGEPPAWDIDGADDAFAWLEGLAVKQGAEEALLLHPDERKETPPDWVQADVESQQEEKAPEIFAQEAQIPEAEAAEIPDWLQELGPKGVEETAVPEPGAELPDWIQTQPEAQAASSSVEEEPSEEEPLEEAESAEIPDWLQALEPQDSETEEIGQEASGIAREIPDWLEEAPEMEAPEIPAEEAQLIEQGMLEEPEAAEIPDWLQALEPQDSETEEVETQAPADEVELPEWPREKPETQATETPPQEGELLAEEPLGEAEPVEIPDWLQALEPQISEPEEVETRAPADQSLSPEWPEEEPEIAASEMLSGEAEFAEEEPVAELEPAEIPDWLQALEPQPEHEEVLEQAQLEAEAELTDEGWFSEGPPILGDTQPVKVPSEAQPAAGESEAETEEQAPQAAQIQAQEGLQAEISPAEEEILAEQWSEEAETAEAQAWMPDTGLEAEVEQAELEGGIAEPVSESDEWQPEELEPAASEEAAGLLSEMQESDDAFAWLESLAVRQGAEEALILNPEERSEEPPEWVQAEIEEAEQAEPEPAAEVQPVIEEQPAAEEPEEAPEGILAEEELSPEEARAMEIEALAEEAPGELEQPPAEEPAPVPEEILAEQEVSPEEAIAIEIEALAEEQPGELEQPPAEEQLAVEEQPQEAGAGEEIPELPDWLQEGVSESGEEAAWTPPAIERPLEKLDLNQASLVELERLPDIGFRMAQNIVNYRDTYGPFKAVDDLLNIPGLGPEILADIRDWLYVMPQAEEAIEEPVASLVGPEIEQGPAELMEARQQIARGDFEQAAQSYTQAIKNNLHLEAIIQDLQVATQNHPQAIYLWQALGDAHLRAGQIQLALDAYNQAEKLLN